MNDYKTQEKKIVEQLLEHGKVSRNWALRNFISRLGAIIFDLKEAGWDIQGRFERTHGGFGKGKDYVYTLISSPVAGIAKKEEERPYCDVCRITHPVGAIGCKKQ